MKTIWKYILQVQDQQTIEIPSAYSILLIQVQHNNICMWVQVDSNSPKMKLPILMIGTGYEIPSSSAYHIGTVLDGEFVWHFFTQLI